MIGEDRDAAESDEMWTPSEPAPRLALRLEAIGRRIDAHPWLVVGVAAVAGAALAVVPPAMMRRGRRRERVGRTFGEGALALIGAIAARIVRDYAIDSVAAAAHKWAHGRE